MNKQPGQSVSCRATAEVAERVEQDKAPSEDIAHEAFTQEASYDWRNQWYPVHFTADLPEGQPQRVWLFDEAIVVLRRPGKGPVALLDRCPHRAAALSQGRMTAAGYLQCAYHGWSFSGETGECTNIPQVAPGSTLTGRTCATALPCVERQGLLWVYPSPGATPSPDTIVGLPELDRPGWTSDDFARDMPVDFTLLLENVADPDHGVFAHQSPILDSFSASPQHAMRVSREPGPGGAKIVGRVPGVLKLTGKDAAARNKAMPGEAGTAAEVTATLAFEPPCLCRWSRFDASGRTSFITAFYCVPAGSKTQKEFIDEHGGRKGVGRTRFLTRYARSIAPWFHPPRWLFAIFLNAFLDQDTFLLATQQETTLARELNAAQQAYAQHGAHSMPNGEVAGPATNAATKGIVRQRLFCHRSPTDSLLIAMGRWMDAAVPLVPNRYHGVLSANGAGPVALAPARRDEVLDRYACHTAISPASLAAFRAAQLAHALLRGAAGVAAPLAALRLAAPDALPPWAGNWALGVCALSLVGAPVAATLAKQFKYVYTQDKQSKDLKRITNFVKDIVS